MNKKLRLSAELCLAGLSKNVDCEDYALCFGLWHNQRIKSDIPVNGWILYRRKDGLLGPTKKRRFTLLWASLVTAST